VSIRSPQDELTQPIRAISQWRDDLRAARLNLAKVDIDILDEQMHEPRVIPCRLRIYFVGALAQHHMEAVQGKKTPPRRVDRILAEAENAQEIAGGPLKISHREY